MLLEALRHEKQVEVARNVRCSQGFVSRLASGEKSLTDLGLSVRFERAYGIPPSAWLAPWNSDADAPVANIHTDMSGRGTRVPDGHD